MNNSLSLPAVGYEETPDWYSGMSACCIAICKYDVRYRGQWSPGMRYETISQLLALAPHAV